MTLIKTMRIGNTVVCTIDNKMYKKTCESFDEVLELFEKASNTDEYSEEEVQALKDAFLPPKTEEEEKQEEELKELVAEVEKQKTLVDWMKEIEQNGDPHFELVGLKLYMKGINITVPEFLAQEFAKRRSNQEDLNAIMNFWRLCALNPDPRCREDLYGFLQKNDLSITPSGYFVTYRNVNIMQEGNKMYNDFIIESWFKTKKQKKSPKNYSIIKTSDGELKCIPTANVKSHSDYLNEAFEDHGILSDLYESINEDREGATVYTDAHTGTFEIRIGELVKIDRSECDANPDQTCSRGLHSGNLNFMNSQGYYFGSVGIVCLINPRDVVAVPSSYDGKMRSCAYLPIALTQYDEKGKIIPVDTTTFEYEYATHTQKELEDMLKNMQLESMKEHEIIPKEMSLVALRQIVDQQRITLDEMTRVVNSRVTTV